MALVPVPRLEPQIEATMGRLPTHHPEARVFVERLRERGVK
jgi:hypothetical protein